MDEITCIGCKHCAHVARNTFYIEPDYGRSRAIRQDGDGEALIQEAIDTCPVDCIHWVTYAQLQRLEQERQHQAIPGAGLPIDAAAIAQKRYRQKITPIKSLIPSLKVDSYHPWIEPLLRIRDKSVVRWP